MITLTIKIRDFTLKRKFATMYEVNNYCSRFEEIYGSNAEIIANWGETK